MSLQLIVLSLEMFTVAPEIILSSNEVLAEEKQPQPSITWSKAFGNLPINRAEVIKGALKIYNVTKKDRGIYICRAENILGSAAGTFHLMVFSRLRFKARPPKEIAPRLAQLFICRVWSRVT